MRGCHVCCTSKGVISTCVCDRMGEKEHVCEGETKFRTKCSFNFIRPFSTQSSTFPFSHPLLHLWVWRPFCQGHGNKSQLTSCSTFTSICSCIYLKATAVRAAASLSGQLAGTCKIRPQHISLSEECSHSRLRNTASATPAVHLILTKPISWQPHAKMPLKHEHRTLLGYLNIWGIPPRCSKWRRFVSALTFLNPCINFLVVLHVKNVTLTGVKLILLQPNNAGGRE